MAESKEKIESEMWRGQNKKTKSKISEAKEFVIEPLLESIMAAWF